LSLILKFAITQTSGSPTTLRNFCLASTAAFASLFVTAATAEIVIVDAQRSVFVAAAAAVGASQCCNTLADESVQASQRSDSRTGVFAQNLERLAQAEAAGFAESARAAARQQSTILLSGDQLSVAANGGLELSREFSERQSSSFPGTSASASSQVSIRFTLSTPLLFFASVEFFGPPNFDSSRSASLTRSEPSVFGTQTVFLTNTGANFSGTLAAGSYTLTLSLQSTLQSFRRDLLSANQDYALSFTTSPVPLPASAWLLLSACGGLLVCARRSRHAPQLS
jgi:hypothetical protein